jgi:hypothetical protein
MTELVPKLLNQLFKLKEKCYKHLKRNYQHFKTLNVSATVLQVLLSGLIPRQILQFLQLLLALN